MLRLKPVTWQWKNDPAGGTQLGMIAQEVEPLIPEVVIHDLDSEQGLFITTSKGHTNTSGQ